MQRSIVIPLVYRLRWILALVSNRPCRFSWRCAVRCILINIWRIGCCDFAPHPRVSPGQHPEHCIRVKYFTNRVTQVSFFWCIGILIFERERYKYGNIELIFVCDIYIHIFIRCQRRLDEGSFWSCEDFYAFYCLWRRTLKFYFILIIYI